MNETNLILESADTRNPFPPFSARDCTQSLSLLPVGTVRRTINGQLLHLSPHAFKKFFSIIRCKDLSSPAFEKFGAGTRVKVGCIQTLNQEISVGVQYVTLERFPVAVYLYDKNGQYLPFKAIEATKVFLPDNFPGGFLTYRPWLFMLIKTYFLETNEWGIASGWRLELEEE